MKKIDPTQNNSKKKLPPLSPDFTSPETNSDKSGDDNDADRTVKRKKNWKSKLGIDPDSTGIDTKADKTKKEKFPNPQK